MASSNSFVGVVPDDIMKQRQPKELVLNGNRELGGVLDCHCTRLMLHGEIPTFSSKFQATGLEYLNLSYNFLDGPVPRSEKVWNLRALDLSHNLLSGQIPAFH
ncbi:hypothetical protein V6N13_131555 [Hibiscus sabdariffa]